MVLEIRPAHRYIILLFLQRVEGSRIDLFHKRHILSSRNVVQDGINRLFSNVSSNGALCISQQANVIDESLNQVKDLCKLAKY